eukprot:scaffold25972_cov32-Tisochrysis_lutea.AAC.6
MQSGIGRDSDCCLKSSRAPLIHVKTPVPEGEPETDPENIKLLSWRASAGASLDDGAKTRSCPSSSTRDGVCTASPKGLDCASHCVMRHHGLGHAAFDRVQPNHWVVRLAYSGQPNPREIHALAVDHGIQVAAGRRQSGLTHHEGQSHLSGRRLGKQPGLLKRPVQVSWVDLGTEPIDTAAQDCM